MPELEDYCHGGVWDGVFMVVLLCLERCIEVGFWGGLQSIQILQPGIIALAPSTGLHPPTY